MSEPRVKWLSDVDSEAAKDVYANIPDMDLVAIDTKTGIAYTGKAFQDNGLKGDLRLFLGCDGYAPAPKRVRVERATKRMLRAV